MQMNIYNNFIAFRICTHLRLKFVFNNIYNVIARFVNLPKCVRILKQVGSYLISHQEIIVNG